MNNEIKEKIMKLTNDCLSKIQHEFEKDTLDIIYENYIWFLPKSKTREKFHHQTMEKFRREDKICPRFPSVLIFIQKLVQPKKMLRMLSNTILI